MNRVFTILTILCLVAGDSIHAMDGNLVHVHNSTQRLSDLLNRLHDELQLQISNSTTTSPSDAEISLTLVKDIRKKLEGRRYLVEPRAYAYVLPWDERILIYDSIGSIPNIQLVYSLRNIEWYKSHLLFQLNQIPTYRLKG